MDQLIRVLGATPQNITESLKLQRGTGIVTDSRCLVPQNIFVALRGERFDGHAFVGDVLQRGALTAVINRSVALDSLEIRASETTSLPLLQVDDTLAAYQAIAQWWRSQFPIPVIGVTGSVGKTTTKELIAAVLSTQGRVLKTEANHNNEIGVPKTLLNLDAHYDFAVIEMAMRAAGEIGLLAQIARPDIAVITNVGTAHIGRLGSEGAIAAAKCELLSELPSTGTAVLNADNPLLLETAQRVWTGPTLTFGLTGGDLRGEVIDGHTLVVDGVPLPLPLPGHHNALNYLAALAVARILQVDWEPLKAGLSLNLPAGRSQRIDLPNDIVILDETYNAGLESMTAALHLLAETPGDRHIAVLGTMKELGDRSVDLHHQVGQTVRQLQLDHLLILADPAEGAAMATGAMPVPTEQFSDHGALAQRLQALIKSGDRLLFKASRSVALDRVVAEVRSQRSA
ncbi:MAG: UDP-N-acetylmuramoyl-tripeptide--D-alanyl-D-alanine ligase [Synechococcales bacterium]|nr:UDP-N-acetylmuramoyl-tripeptide--D-alanyl-D-alanine ligase [Synechococcales bacterium]